jgi:copper chaperone
MKAKLNIEGMSCEHCVNAVTNAISEFATNVKVNLKKKTAKFDYDPDTTNLDEIKAAIEAEDFKVVE